MNKRQVIVSIVISFLFLISGAVGFQLLKAKKTSTVVEGPLKTEIKYVNAETFTIKDYPSTISIDGRVNAFEKIDLAAEVTGRVIPSGNSWKQGSAFHRGQLLFKIENTDERLNLYAQRSNLLNAITQIMPDLKFDFPEAFNHWQAYLDSFAIEAQTKPLPKPINQKEKYYVAGKNIYNLYYSIKSAEDRLGNFYIYAPFSGVFLSVNAYPGSLVNPGSQLGRIMNTSRYELQTPIPMKDLELVNIGQTVDLLERQQNVKYHGKIQRIGKAIDQTTQSVPIFITVNGKGLKDGMYLTGELQGGTLKAVTALPTSAIVNQNEVYTLRDSTIFNKPIEVVLRTDDKTYVRGVETNEMIIITGLNSISPGQKAALSKRNS